jgi:GNAT superfamily N-acetyltransferase
MRIAQIDPQSETALSLLRDAAQEVRPLYGEAPGPPWPRNRPLGPRDIYVAAFVQDTAVGCGAIRELDANACEAHRMYVLPGHRRQGVARAILAYLHAEATRLGYKSMRLETGNRQVSAIALYESYGFSRIAAFGSYVNDPTSVCYELDLGATAPWLGFSDGA